MNATYCPSDPLTARLRGFVVVDSLTIRIRSPWRRWSTKTYRTTKTLARVVGRGISQRFGTALEHGR